MSKKRSLKVKCISTLIMLISVLAILSIGCSESASDSQVSNSTSAAEIIELDFPASPTFWTSEHAYTAAVWMDNVAEASNGRVKFNVLVGAAPVPQIYDSIANGTFDVACNPIMCNTGRFPFLEAFTLPEVDIECKHPSQCVWEMFQDYPEINAEFSDTKLLSVWASTPSLPGIGFSTISKPINSLEDLQGVKMGCFGTWVTKRVEALGAVPVNTPPEASYENLHKKIVDGTLMDSDGLEHNNIQEIVSYYHYVNMQFVPFYLVMNIDTWNSLPADIQNIMLEKAALIPDASDTYHGESNAKCINNAKSEFGLQVITYSKEELTKWNKAVAPVTQEYAAALDELGYDGTDVFARWKELMIKHAN